MTSFPLTPAYGGIFDLTLSPEWRGKWVPSPLMGEGKGEGDIVILTQSAAGGFSSPEEVV
jgi:hypothetical protein